MEHLVSDISSSRVRYSPTLMIKIDNSLPTSKPVSKVLIAPTKVSPRPIGRSPITEAVIVASSSKPFGEASNSPKDNSRKDENTSTVSSKADPKQPEADSTGDRQPSFVKKQDIPPQPNPVESSLEASVAPASCTEVSSKPKIEVSVEPDAGKVFTRYQFLPLTFHVPPGSAQKAVQKMITVSLPLPCYSKLIRQEQGGGVLVSRTRAAIILDLDLNPQGQDWKSEVWISPDGSRGFVPLGWVLECLASDALIDLRAYEKKD